MPTRRYDIYAQSKEDFEAPLPLHVTYEIRGLSGMKTIHEQMSRERSGGCWSSSTSFLIWPKGLGVPYTNS